MRKWSEKRREEEESGVNDIDDFVFLFHECWACGARKWLQTDHIFGRNHELRHHRTNLFRCCAECHANKTTFGREKWLSLKKEKDPDGWNPEVALILSIANNGRRDI